MPAISDTAICIRRWDFSETSQTVSLFTRNHGIIRGLAKGARRAKGAFSGGIDLLTAGQALAIVKPGLELATITTWHVQHLFTHLRRQLAANRAALYTADLVHHMVIDHDPHPQLFDALLEALDAMADPGVVGAALVGFQWAVLHECGYRPQLACDVRTGRELTGQEQGLGFDPAAGGVIVEPPLESWARPPGPTRSWRVRRETIELLRTLTSGDRSWRDIAGPPQVVQRANRLLAAYARELIGREVPTLRWAFPDNGR